MEYKSVNEYLLALSDELKYMSPKDATKVLKFYENKISVALDYGEKEEALLNSLPTPEEVAKEAYESHGIKYLELKKKQYKRKQIVKKIFDIILSVICLISFGVISYLVIFQIIKKINLITLLTKLNNNLFTILGVVFLILAILILFIYVIDLFIIILEFLVESYIPIKDEDKKRKILSFNITSLINEKTKKEKVILKAGLISLAICVIFLITSFATKGYVYNSLMDKTSNIETINIDEDITNFTINADLINIDVKKSDNSYISYEYKYEFIHEFNTTIDNQNMILEIPASNSFDILDILKEPTQSLIIYLPDANNVSLTINSNNLLINIDESIINNLTINSSLNLECVISNSNISNFCIKASNSKCGLHNCKVDSFTYESNKGQLILEEDTNIKESTINNNAGLINISKSALNNVTINNSSGSINLNEVKGDFIKFKTKTSTSKMDYCVFKEGVFDIYNTCSLTVEHSIFETSLESSVKNESYFITNYLKCPDIKINAVGGFVFINKIGIDFEQKEYTISSFDLPSNLSIYNETNNSKTEINECNINDLYLNSSQGYVLVLDCNILKGTLSLNSVNICDLENNIGGTIYLHLRTIGSAISMKNNLDTSVEYKVIKWDELSCARLTAEDSVNLNTSEATNNE